MEKTLVHGFIPRQNKKHKRQKHKGYKNYDFKLLFLLFYLE